MHATKNRHEIAAGLTMVVGRRRLADWVVDAAGVGEGTTVVDVGCGPGSVARVAARRGAHVIGIDPSPAMLSLAARFTPRPLAETIHYQLGAAEDLPVPDCMADVVWAVASAHHWRDVPAGLRECRRVAHHGGRLLVVERLVRPGARGHAAHGFTAQQADAVAGHAFDAGFAHVGTETVAIGRKRFVVVHGRTDA